MSRLVRPLTVAGTLLGAAPAWAHAFPERLEAALPLSWYLVGAGLAVAISFLGAARWMRPGPVARPLAALALPETLPRRVQRIGGAIGLGLFVLVLLIGLIGPQADWQRNALPVAVWVLFWVGLLLTAALIGNLFALLNPWAALGRLLPTPARDRTVPIWPAPLALLVFAWLELAWPHNADPRALVAVILLYTAGTLLAMARYGTAPWLRRGELFAGLFALAGRLAPLTVAVTDDGRHRLILRPWGGGLAEPPAPGPTATLLILGLLAMVTFDGFAETLVWADIAGLLMQGFFRLGLVHALGFTWAGALTTTLGLLAAMLLLGGLYAAALAPVARREGRPWGDALCAYAPSLLPIALGYHLAHYFSYLLIEGRLIVAILSDPFGRGWNLFGTAGHTVDILDVNMRAIWGAALIGVIGGHVLGVLAAHRIALRRLGDPGRAWRAHLPLVVLMILYTVTSLWILSQPIVDH